LFALDWVGLQVLQIRACVRAWTERALLLDGPFLAWGGSRIVARNTADRDRKSNRTYQTGLTDDVSPGSAVGSRNVDLIRVSLPVVSILFV
jgi:hypothetical protein